MEFGHPVPNRDFLMGAFESLGEHRREALKLAAGFSGEEVLEEGLTEELALETVVGWLSPERLMELASEAVTSTSGTGSAPKLGRPGSPEPGTLSEPEQFVELGLDLGGLPEVDRLHAEVSPASQLISMSSMKTHASDGSRPCQGYLVDPRVGLATADEA